jgi:hypothetical protein
MNNKNILLLLSLSLSAGAYADNYKRIKVSDDVPISFKSISEESQHPYDLYLNDRYVGTMLSSSRNNKAIYFNAIKGALSNIDGKKRDISFIIETLSLPINMESNVFIKENESIIVSLNHQDKKINVTQKKSLDNKQFNHSGFSWKSNLKGNFSKNEDQKDSKTVYWNSSFSKGEQSFYITSTLNNDEYNIDNAYYSKQIDQDRLNIGVTQTDLNSFGSMSSRKTLGLTYLNNATAKESNKNRKPIGFTLISPAQITIKKNNELIHISRQDSGTTSIDTSKFPAGNYPVIIKIKYDNGEIQEIERFISANHSLSSKSGFSGFSIGLQKEDQEYFTSDYDDSSLLLRASYIKPINDNITSYINAGYQDDSFVINPAFILNYENFYAQSSYLINDNGKWFTDNYARIENDNHDITAGFNSNYYDDEYNSKNFYTRYQYKHDTLGRFMFSYNKSSAFSDIETYQVSHDIPLYKSGDQSLKLRTTLSHSTESFFGLELTYRLGKPGGAFSYNGAIVSNSNENMFKHQIAHRGQYNNGYVSTSVNSVTGNKIGNKFIQSSINDYRYGYLNVQAGSLKTPHGNKEYANASFDVSFAGNDNKALITGQRNINTGLVLDLSHMPDDELTLTVNKKTIKLRGGNKHVISLKPHQEYTVNLKNNDNPNQKIQSKEQKIYLYSGNLAFLNWDSYDVILFSGRAMKNNTPLSNKMVSSSLSKGLTDKNGYFTLEVKKTDRILDISNNKCNIIIDNENLTFEDVHCK